jgi:hypothetical protein
MAAARDVQSIDHLDGAVESDPPPPPPVEPLEGGPIDAHPWPAELTAHVVQPGPAPRIHGLDVQADLARHYRFAEVALLALTGEPPSAEAGRAFDIALIFLAPISIAEAPAHAATLARLCGAAPSGVIAVGATTLAEQARTLVVEHRELLGWLACPEGPLPAVYRARSEPERRAVERLRAALAVDAIVPSLLEQDPTLDAALIAVLHASGVVRPEALEAAVCLARLGAMVAEAFAATPLDFEGYPMRTPPFAYVEDGR